MPDSESFLEADFEEGTFSSLLFDDLIEDFFSLDSLSLSFFSSFSLSFEELFFFSFTARTENEDPLLIAPVTERERERG